MRVSVRVRIVLGIYQRCDVLTTGRFANQECNNVATWCGSICGYTQKVDAPSCDESTNRIIGTSWVEDTKVECTKIEKKKKGDGDADEAALGVPVWRRFVNVRPNQLLAARCSAMVS